MNGVVLLTAALLLAPAGDAGKRVVIPFDFESKFDEGETGKTIGDMVWQKLNKEKKCILPESMLDVREVCDRLEFRPGPATPLSKLSNVVRKEFEADIAIWGSIERAGQAVTDEYDLHIKVVDFKPAEPLVLYESTARTKAASEIPHLYMKAMLAKLYGDKAAPPAIADAAAEKAWKEGPNLVVNGSFEKGKDSPVSWDSLPQYMTWVRPSAVGRFVKMTIPRDVAETTGVLYYSDYFPVEPGATYRFSCRFRTTGTAAKVFVKCYDQFVAGRTEDGKTSMQRREVYRSQQNLKGAADQWTTHVEDFTPQYAKFRPRWGRVMLYAYYPAGVVEWDDVVVKMIKGAPAANTRSQSIHR